MIEVLRVQAERVRRQQACHFADRSAKGSVVDGGGKLLRGLTPQPTHALGQ
jgi:hypothetical protein